MSEPVEEKDQPRQYFEDIRVIDPKSGISLFEVGQPWPQAPTSAALVQTLYEQEMSRETDSPVPEKFKGNRAVWADDVDGRVKKLRQDVAGKVADGEPRPTYAMIDTIKIDGDRVVVIGRGVGRWQEEGKAPSVDLPYGIFAVERRWYGNDVLAEYVAELDADDDEDDDDDADDEDKPAPPPPVVEKQKELPDICLECGTKLGGQDFCAKCGTPRGSK